MYIATLRSVLNCISYKIVHHLANTNWVSTERRQVIGHICGKSYSLVFPVCLKHIQRISKHTLQLNILPPRIKTRFQPAQSEQVIDQGCDVLYASLNPVQEFLLIFAQWACTLDEFCIAQHRGQRRSYVMGYRVYKIVLQSVEFF